jgi:hypothetical protein
MTHSRYTGPLPTIADNKRLGMTGFRVECATLYCHHTKRVEFDALGLPDDTVFLDIPKLRRFVWEEGGGREATARADWNDYYEVSERERQKRLNEAAASRRGGRRR